MTISLEQQTSFSRIKEDVIIFPWFLGQKKAAITLPADAVAIIESLFKNKEFSGRTMETVVVRIARPRMVRILLVGLGAEKALTGVGLSHAIGAAVMRVKKMRVKSVAIVLPDGAVRNVRDVEHIALGIRQANYSFTKYKSKKSDESRVLAKCAVQLSRKPIVEEKDAVRRANILADGMELARSVGNSDAVEVTPEHLAVTARGLAKEFPTITTRVLGVKELEKEKCGGILAVGKGSQHEPRMIVLEYNPVPQGIQGKHAPKGTQPLVVVGKAITFDTGGISIKPWKQMDEMKFDMMGGAAVLGLMRTIAALQLPVHVVGILAAAENMPSHTAFKPGDVVRMADGTTVEVISTDAEGRMVVADALVYARRYKPVAMVDLATLTGAVIAALGDYATGLFTDDEKLAETLVRIGNETGDRVWRLPLVAEWKKTMKSIFADLKNASDGKMGGATMGGLFLQHFVEKKTPWAHLDIAGTAWNMAASPWMEAGATGAGIPLLLAYLQERSHAE